MAATRVKEDRAAQVQACLATVMDPELDEPVTELGFVTAVALLDDGEVHISFRLPTYWCAANFAFLMADDMRCVVQALPWVSQVSVRLQEHMYAEEINRGVAVGRGFQASFGAAAEGGLESLRLTFLLKAFQRRQAALLQHLLDAGVTAETLVALDRAALPALTVDGEGARLVARYLERRSVVAGELAFVDSDGRTLEAMSLTKYLRGLVLININMEFNGALCRGLLSVRYPDGQTLSAPTGAAQLQAQPIHIVRRAPPVITH
jgi:metal-sulfur cluster biosynthetic enzyme